MGKYDGTTIEIVNWEKYNPRKDLKATSWFRFQNSLFEDPNFFDFSAEEIVGLLYLLSLASKKQSGTLKLNYAHAERIGRVSSVTLESTIRKLEGIQFVQIPSIDPNADVTPTSRARHAHVTLRTNERTNETNGNTAREAENLKPEKKPEAGGGAEECTRVWVETLKHFGQPRNLTAGEGTMIVRAIAENGAAVVATALLGARFEPAHEGWDPRQHVDISRVLTRGKDGTPRIQKFYGYGAAAQAKDSARQAKQRQLEQARAEASVVPADEPVQDPERVREFMAAFRNRGMPQVPKDEAS